jgi:hypothetical protein
MSRRDASKVPAIRDFFGGIFLALGLHITFVVLWAIVFYFYFLVKIIPDWNSLNGLMIFLLPILWIGFIQIFYLLPTYSFFVQKQRQEVCKGILTTALLTLLPSGGCAAMYWANLEAMSFLAAMTAIATLIGLGLKFLIDRRF